jgi:hypothetical protein
VAPWLGRDVAGHPFRHVGAIDEEGFEEAYHAELNPETDLVVVPAPAGYEPPLLIVEVEEAGELLPRKFAA